MKLRFTTKENLLNEKQIIRFESKFSIGVGNSCWTWLGYRDRDGYGNFCLNGRPYQAHRISWAYYNNKEIPKGMLICHTCDNPSCINPDHLFLGTPKDNMVDKYNKGRNVNVRGAAVGNSKLTEQDVKHIRTSPMNNRVLAKELGVTHSLISAVQLRKCWKHV